MWGSLIFRAVAHCFRTLSLVVFDLVRFAFLAAHSRTPLAAENFFLRKQLALFQERKAVCTNRPIRQDYLDQFVWSEIIRLLEDPELVQSEIERRQTAARNADPLRKREE